MTHMSNSNTNGIEAFHMKLIMQKPLFKICLVSEHWRSCFREMANVDDCNLFRIYVEFFDAGTGLHRQLAIIYVCIGVINIDLSFFIINLGSISEISHL